MAADSVSNGSTFFGISSGLDTTNAPGTNGDNSALGADGAPTTDLASGTSASAAAGSVTIPFGVGSHNSTEAQQANRAPLGLGSNPQHTGAPNSGDSGSVHHNHTGVN